jgi:hypothetical protein
VLSGPSRNYLPSFVICHCQNRALEGRKVKKKERGNLSIWQGHLPIVMTELVTPPGSPSVLVIPVTPSRGRHAVARASANESPRPGGARALPPPRILPLYSGIKAASSRAAGAFLLALNKGNRPRSPSQKIPPQAATSSCSLRETLPLPPEFVNRPPKSERQSDCWVSKLSCAPVRELFVDFSSLKAPIFRPLLESSSAGLWW